MTVETFDPKKVANKTTTLETPVKVLSENQNASTSNGNRIGFVSLGCPKNLVDSERILTQLRTEGYDVVPTYNDADLVIVNTCGFIDAAVEESLDTIGEALKENGKVIVTGCLGVKEDEIRELHPNVLAITGPHAYETVVEQVHDHLPKPSHNPFEDLIPDHGVKLTPRHYAYLKISEGCNHRCTFCIIPSMRGDLVSRPVGNVLDEAKRLKDAGVKELLVISQDTSAYGVDLKHRTGFWNGMPVKTHMQQLCEKLGEMGIWVRLHYVYPYPHVDDLIPLMNEGKILPYLDIPFQHASKRILRLMKRPGSSERVLERVKKWREQCPSLVIRSTFIVGFPGETEEEFEELLDFLREAQLDRVGAFAYSPVEGAKANELPDPVPEDIKQARLARFMEVQGEISAARLKARIGNEYQVVIDSVDAEGAVGRTYADAPEVDGVVHLNGVYDVKPGDRVWAEVIHANEHDVWAVLSEDQDDEEQQ
ncbi:ribosomal protein S12 methylthiotransferase RimO [Tenacibaculum sp. KUL152]|jgi:ribosomal protein S12 methylthiotransferase|uniref:30S ribosomal protein S12 methylthiotransferase RimO n=1 Tax=unclassified Alteromonas TaxID=2614992 RepID=UPI0012E5BC2D|nr:MULTISPECIES: 30S ribosomal protein S12 methylthiotransferase RimO [unclassified Alteromonas]WDT84362.1 30S ribosomal protein S12 methylthiotransferase RimO [Alteromonas sp. 009811495]BCO19248.1 ribosomal protein S12 methylthiotransferase RimO [Alteromonas sp. KC3]BCO23208.1 ribosomal protein S12 methylthiotransferase RimO [Alteromonas sp. KC14]GFD88642.1 ribosomal protein S12 methylthiotransferase RimO [Tenacibaculum sp. KUL152]